MNMWIFTSIHSHWLRCTCCLCQSVTFEKDKILFLCALPQFMASDKNV